jgi:hypothetical protein
LSFSTNLDILIGIFFPKCKRFERSMLICMLIRMDVCASCFRKHDAFY